MLHKEAEQLVLCAGQFQQDSVFVCLPLQQPDGDAARFQYGFSCAGRICTAKQCIDPRQQDTQLERLGQVIIPVRLLQGQTYKNGILLELTGAEYKLLCFFMQHPNAVLSKEQILDALWDCDGDYIDSSALTVYIRRLRMKIEDDPGKPQMLLTVRGMGYKWNG